MNLITEHQLLIFLIQLFLLLIVARGLGSLFAKIRQPPIVGELMAGILLGPSILGNGFPSIFNWLFPVESPQPQMLESITWVGLLLLMLLAGTEVDISIINKQKKPILLTSIMGIVLPFVLGLLLGLFFLPDSYMESNSQRILFGLFLATALSISAIPVITKILMDLNLFKTKIGIVNMASAMLNDLTGWIIFSIIIGLFNGEGYYFGKLVKITLLTFIFAGFCLTFGRLIMGKILDLTQKKSSSHSRILTLALSSAFLCGAITQGIGIHSVFGSFMAGIMISGSHHLKESTKDIIRDFTTGIFAPLFFATVGLRVDFFRNFDLFLVLIIFLIACVGKILGASLGAKLGGMSNVDSLCIGFGMNARGMMEIILALLGLKYGIIKESVFVALVIMAIVTSLMSGPLIKWTIARSN